LAQENRAGTGTKAGTDEDVGHTVFAVFTQDNRLITVITVVPDDQLVKPEVLLAEFVDLLLSEWKPSAFSLTEANDVTRRHFGFIVAKGASEMLFHADVPRLNRIIRTSRIFCVDYQGLTSNGLFALYKAIIWLFSLKDFWGVYYNFIVLSSLSRK
jgi:hypothetical protein